MQTLIDFGPTLGMAILLAVLLGVLIALEVYNGKRVQKLAYPAYEYALKQAEQEADRIVMQAREEARQLVEKAEAESVALVGTHKGEDDAAAKEYQQTLHAMLENLEAELKENSRAAKEATERASSALASQLEGQGKDANTRLADAYEALQKGAATRMEEQITQAFKAAQREAQAYEKARKEIVDDHILALVSETTKIVLQKDIAKGMHAELVRSALEEAKANHIF